MKIIITDRNTNKVRRELIVISNNHCFVISRYVGNDISIWTDGLTKTEGLSLYDTYITNKNRFGRLRSYLFKKNQNQGFSERGSYTSANFCNLLQEYGFGISSEQAHKIYSLIYESKLTYKTIEKD